MEMGEAETAERTEQRTRAMVAKREVVVIIVMKRKVYCKG